MRTTRTDKLVDLPSLLRLRQAYRQAQRTVVWTNGCFDLLHAGHVLNLQAASQLGDVLVVGLNSDDSVRQLKGDGRPIFPVLARAEVLAALECVDHVLVFADRTPTAVLARLRPDVHCKGADYAPPHGQPVPERAVVEAHGGRVAFLPLLPGLSTTDLLRRLARLAPPPDPDGHTMIFTYDAGPCDRAQLVPVPPDVEGSIRFHRPRNAPDDQSPEPDAVLAPQQDVELPDTTRKFKASGAT